MLGETGSTANFTGDDDGSCDIDINTFDYGSTINTLRSRMDKGLTDFDLERISQMIADDDGSSTSMMTRRKPHSPFADIHSQTAPLVAFCQWALEIKPSLATLQDAAKACQTYPRASLSPSNTGLSIVLYSEKTRRRMARERRRAKSSVASMETLNYKTIY